MGAKRAMPLTENHYKGSSHVKIATKVRRQLVAVGQKEQLGSAEGKRLIARPTIAKKQEKSSSQLCIDFFFAGEERGQILCVSRTYLASQRSETSAVYGLTSALQSNTARLDDTLLTRKPFFKTGLLLICPNIRTTNLSNHSLRELIFNR